MPSAIEERPTTIAPPPPPAGNGEKPPLIYEHPDKVVRSPFNRHIDTKSEAFTELVASVKRHGVIEPLVARRVGNVLELIAGERRWRAASAGKLSAVPIIIRKATDAEVIELQTVENEKRQDLSPIEQAEKYQQAIDQYGKEKPPVTGEKAIERLAAAVHKGKSTIYEALRLVKLPAKVKEAVAKKNLPPSHAGLLAKLPEEMQGDLVKAIAPGKPLNQREDNDIQDAIGFDINERDDNGLVSFRETKEVVDETLRQLDQAKKYDVKAAEFRKKGGKAMTFVESRKQPPNEFIASGDYVGDFSDYANALAKKAKDKLPEQIMRPQQHNPAQPELVWRRSEFVAALKKAGVKARTYGGGGGSTTDYAKAKRKREEERRTRKTILAKILGPLRVAAGKRNAKIPWPLLLATAAGYSANQICGRRKWGTSYINYSENFKKHLAKLPENQMAGVVVDYLIEEFTSEHSGSYRPDLEELTSFYKIDAKAIRKEFHAAKKKEPAPDARKITGLTAAGRKRLGKLMKARWSARQNAKKKARRR